MRQEILISASSDMRASADALALSIYQMQPHYARFTGSDYVPVRGGLSLVPPHKEETYQNNLKHADFCFYLYGDTLDDACTQRFFDTYKREQELFRGLKRLYVFCPHSPKNTASSIDTPLERFTQQLDRELEQFCALFCNPEHLQYLAAEQIWISQSKTALPLESNYEHDKLTFLGGMQLSLKQLPFIQYNNSYRCKQELLHQLQKSIEELSIKELNEPLPPDQQQLLSDQRKRCTELRLEIKQELDYLFHHSLDLARWRSACTTARVRLALRDFDSGKTQAALAHLEEVEHDAREQLNNILHHEAHRNELRHTLRAHIQELRAKISLYGMDGRLPISERANKAYHAYTLLLKIMVELQVEPEELADELVRCAWLCHQQQRRTLAIDHYQKALDIYEQHSSTSNFLTERARIYNNLGNLYYDCRQYEQSQNKHLASIQCYEQLTQSERELYLPDLAMAHNNLGNLYQHTQQAAQARVHYVQSRQLYRRLSLQHPILYRHDLATATVNLANHYKDKYQYAKAEILYLQALPIRQQLIAEDPQRHQAALAQLWNNLGVLYNQTSRYAEAESAYQACRTIREELAQENPEVYLSPLARLYHNIAELYRDTPRDADAESYYKRSLVLLEQLAQQQPSAPPHDLAHSLQTQAEYYQQRGNAAKAISLLQRCCSIRQALAASNPTATFPALVQNLANLIDLCATTQADEERRRYQQELYEVYTRLKQLELDARETTIPELIKQLTLYFHEGATDTDS